MTDSISPEYAERPPAIRWLRAYTPAQICLCGEVISTWHELMRESADSGHAYPLQVRGRHRRFQVVAGEQEEKPIRYHVVARTLLTDYTLQVYRQALQKVGARYPGWNAHRFVSGPLVGERRIEWLDRAFPFAWSKFESYIWRIIDKGGYVARESVTVDACDARGRLPGEPQTDDCWADGFEYRLIRICVDAEELTEELEREWTERLKAGQLPSVGGAEKAFTYKQVVDNLVVVSDAEIALINRADAREPLTDADRALFLACGSLDEAGIEAAIRQGANCNVINEHEETPLFVFVMANGFNRYALYENERGDQMTYLGGPPVPLGERDELRILNLLLRHGAHPDLTGLEELTPLAQAAVMRCPHIVRALCEAGADTGVHSLSDRCFGGWPDAWGYAVTDADLYGGAYHQVVAELERKLVTPYDEDEPDTAEDGTTSGEPSDVEEAPPSLYCKEPLRDLVPTPTEAAWMESVIDPRLGEALLRYARAFNLLDATWVSGAIAEEATYDSQAVFETLRGRARISRYLSGKIATLQRHIGSMRVRMELGHHRAIGCCVVVHQWDRDTDIGENDHAVGLMTIAVNAEGKIAKFSMATVAPHPCEAQRTGIYPGI